MSAWDDNPLSVYLGVFSSLLGRAMLFVLACAIGMMAAFATAEHRFVWPWEALADGVCIAPVSFFVLMFVNPAAALIYPAVIVLLWLFLRSERIRWAWLLVPLFLIWYASHSIFVAFRT